jgi:hypothetical protein
MTTPAQKLAQQRWREKNPDYLKKRYEQNKEKWNKDQKQYRQDNLEKCRERDRIYRKTYKEKHGNHITRWRDILYNTLDRFGKKKEGHTHELLKYSANELKEHLDKQGMIWNEHEIDHKIPITWFNPETPPHIVNDLRNLQPLTKEENNEKSNKYCHTVDKEYYDIVIEWIQEEHKNKVNQ